MTYVLNEAQEAWLKALESGEYEQAKGTLLEDGALCCLGVGCLVAGMTDLEIMDYEGSWAATAPDTVADLLKLRGPRGELAYPDLLAGESTLAGANDRGVPFSEIAAFIRANPTAVFVE